MKSIHFGILSAEGMSGSGGAYLRGRKLPKPCVRLWGSWEWDSWNVLGLRYPTAGDELFCRPLRCFYWWSRFRWWAECLYKYIFGRIKLIPDVSSYDRTFSDILVSHQNYLKLLDWVAIARKADTVAHLFIINPNNINKPTYPLSFLEKWYFFRLFAQRCPIFDIKIKIKAMSEVKKS